MKIIFLNVWHGNQKEQLKEFITEHRDTTDIFCFQESHYPAYEELKQELFSDFENVQTLVKKKKLGETDLSMLWSNETFYKKDFTLAKETVLFEDNYECGLGLVTHFVTGDKRLVVGNIHGFPWPGEKLDTEIRLYQTQTILEYFDKENGTKVIGGDFNLLPDTRSIDLFAEGGYQNLIKNFSIETTRNELSWSKYPNNPKQLYADFTFVSPDVKVKSFEVPKNEVSDHLPMILEFDL